MQIKDYKCKCGHNDFFFANKGSQKGIYCSYCGKWVKWADKDEQNLVMKQEFCDDAISRQAVLNLVVVNHTELNGLNVVMYSPLCKDIKQLPHVNTQLKTGHWIDTGSGQECSECGEIQYGYDNHRCFCANCGAKMESEG